MKLLYLGYSCLLIGIITMVYLQHLGINLTEDQVSKEYLWWWIFAGNSSIIGLILILNELL